MYRVAIIEDDINDQKAVLDCLNRYSEKKGALFETSLFSNGLSFLDEKALFDIVFFDIERPHRTGREAARKLREKDKSVAIIFITRVRQYAIEGYSVGASDYLLKPVRYEAFEFRMDNVLNQRIKNKPMDDYRIKTKDSVIKIHVNDIKYIESYSHRIVFHTVEGDYETWDTLSRIEKQIRPYGFSRCHASFLVNNSRINKIDNQYAYIGEDKVKISEDKRKQFLLDFAKTMR